MNTENTWYDKALYNMPMDRMKYDLPFYKCDGVTFERNGETFLGDDTVVVGGHIGNIERVNLTEGYVGLGLSYPYDECMNNPEDWHMYSGYRGKIDGIRHATEEEIAKYNISAGLTCAAAEAADIAYKERRIAV